MRCAARAIADRPTARGLAVARGAAASFVRHDFVIAVARKGKPIIAITSVPTGPVVVEA